MATDNSYNTHKQNHSSDTFNKRHLSLESNNNYNQSERCHDETDDNNYFRVNGNLGKVGDERRYYFDEKIRSPNLPPIGWNRKQ